MCGAQLGDRPQLSLVQMLKEERESVVGSVTPQACPPVLCLPGLFPTPSSEETSGDIFSGSKAEDNVMWVLIPIFLPEVTHSPEN